MSRIASKVSPSPCAASPDGHSASGGRPVLLVEVICTLLQASGTVQEQAKCLLATQSVVRGPQAYQVVGFFPGFPAMTLSPCYDIARGHVDCSR